ncbi:MAG: hypothetical protein KDE20_07525 [Caldilineaceae bacterium]|nr:hypothetical protein [Caldilineaceae bacterium]
MPREAVYTLRIDTRQAQAEYRRFLTDVQRQTQASMRTMNAQAGGARASGGAAQSPESALASLRAVKAGIVAFAGAAVVRQIASTTIELTDLGTEARRAGVAFEYISGGADKAAANLAAIQRASQGTLTTLDAQRIATSALNLGLAKNAEELERVTTISRGIVSVSPVINDMQSAFSELSLTLANMSWRRLDQLGLSVEEVRAKYDALREADASLSDQAAFSQAVLDTAEQKFGELARGADMAATGLERIRVKWAEMRVEVGKEIEGSGFFDAVANDIDRMDAKIAQATAEGAVSNATRGRNRARGGMIEMDTLATQLSNSSLKTSDDAILIASFRAQAELYRRELAQLNQEWMAAQIEAAKLNPELMEQAQAMGALTDAINPATQTLGQYTDEAAKAAEASAELAEMQAHAAEVRQKLDDAIQAGASSIQRSVFSDTGDIQASIRAYDNAERSLRSYVSAAQEAGVGMDTLLNLMPEIVAQLGEQVANLTRATDGAARLTEANTALAQSLGAASTAMVIYSRNLAAMGTTALNVAGAIASAAATGAPGRRSARIPFVGGLNADQVSAAGTPALAREYKGMSVAAKETLDAWKDAASSTASAWKAELESALQGIPGLFDTSPVTAEDMAAAAAGTYQEKPDEYLRQLRDEVRNGKDYPNVDIVDAATRAGIDPNLPKEEILRQFEGMWADSSLFAEGRNLDLINQDAVQAALDRNARSQSGEAAIMRLFGIEPAGGGGMGGATFTGAGGEGASGLGGVGEGMGKAIESGFKEYDFSAATKSMADSLLSAVNQEENAAAFQAVGGAAAGKVFEGFSEGVGDYDWAAAILAAIAEQMSGEYDDE